MLEFICDMQPIPASRKRIISASFCDVDRIDLHSASNFTGSAILVTVFTLSARYQYHLAFFTLSNKLAEIWHFVPSEISISNAASFEEGLRNSLRTDHGLTLNRVQNDSPNLNVLLSRIPVAYDDENATAPVGIFTPSNDKNSSSALLDNDKKALCALFAQL